MFSFHSKQIVKVKLILKSQLKFKSPKYAIRFMTWLQKQTTKIQSLEWLATVAVSTRWLEKGLLELLKLHALSLYCSHCVDN